MILPVRNAVITSHYGRRTLNGKIQFHDGIDFISRENNNVYAITAGRCSFDMDNYNEAARWIDPHMSGGNMVIMDHIINEILYHTRYLHLKENILSRGQDVPEGFVIGHYADVGISYGAHLHIDIYNANWKKLNIEKLFEDWGIL